MSEKGLISEWNEGTFKSTRLHEIQEHINALRLNPLGFNGGKFNYETMYLILNNLYHEGFSKYADEEVKICDAYMKAIKTIINDNPPTIRVTKQEIGGNSTNLLVDKVKLDRLIGFLTDFERLIKKYNDLHGLTTANRDDDMGDPYN